MRSPAVLSLLLPSCLTYNKPLSTFIKLIMETWKDIPGYESLYQVSEHGRVRSLGRLESIANRWGGKTLRRKKVKILRLGSFDNEKRKYITVGLHKDKATTTHEVHRLVMLAFVGEMSAGHCVCHGDGDSRNNRLSNLRYGTYSENAADKRKHGTHVEGESVSWPSLTNSDVKEMRQLYSAGESANYLSVKYKTHANNIRRICRGERFAHAGGPITKRRSSENTVR